MPVGLYADVHVPQTVIDQIRLRGVDILAATEELTNRVPDHELLILSTSLSRVLVTQDIRFKVHAQNLQRENVEFGGLVFAAQTRVAYRDMIFDLELIAKATDAEFWKNRVEELPL